MNRPPVAVVSPQFQEISLPTISTVIDGSREYLHCGTQQSSRACLWAGLAFWGEVYEELTVILSNTLE